MDQMFLQRSGPNSQNMTIRNLNLIFLEWWPLKPVKLELRTKLLSRIQHSGSEKKGSFGKFFFFVHFLGILEILENPQTVENKGDSDHSLEILENLEILEVLEIPPVKEPLSSKFGD